jgi:choice-of-anchor B domain-containing protein
MKISILYSFFETIDTINNLISMRFFSFLLFLALTLSVQAQEANNITLLDNWADPDLPDAGSLSYNDVWGYADCNGNEYGIFGSSAFVHFFNVTDPSNIVEMNAFEGGSTTVWRDMKTYEDHAYAVCDNCTEGLMVFDMSSVPTEVSLALQTTDYFNSSHNIWVDEEVGRLYAVGTNTNGQGMHVFDLTEDPSNPVLIAEPVLEGGYVHDINVFNNIAFASSGNNGLYVYDFTDPANPITLGSLTTYPEQGYNHSSWPTADGTTLIMADETHDRGLKTIDVSDFTDMTTLDVFRSELLAPEATGSIAHNPFIRGNFAFVSYYHDGLQVFDLSDPENVVQVAGYDTEPDNTGYGGFTGMWGTYPFLPSGTILCSDTHRGFYTFSMDNIDLVESPAPLFPTATLTEMGNTSVCEGQSVSLFVDPGAESYEWMQDGTLVSETDMNTYAANVTGDYTVAASNGYCRTMAGETISVTINAYPDADVSTSGDAFLCGSEEETIQITPGADGYIWYLDGQQLSGEVGPNLTTGEPGQYTATVISNNCFSEIEPVTLGGTPDGVSVTYEPGIINSCVGATETLSFTDPEAYDNYQWTFNGENIEGETGTSIDITEPGLYSVSVIFNATCSIGTSEIEATFNTPIDPVVSANMNVLIANNAASWQWYLDGNPIEGATEQSYTALETGAYSVETVDENGCTAISLPEEIIISGIHDTESGIVQILPNPFSSQLGLRLTTDANTAAWRIFDVTGKNMAQAQNVATNGTVFVDTQDWAAGMYFLEVILNGNSVITEKVVKK